MSREQFLQLRRDQVLQERAGRRWTVRVAPFEEDGLSFVILVSGAHVRRVPARFCDDYLLLPLSPYPRDSPYLPASAQPARSCP
jgi:hypothetical protein